MSTPSSSAFVVASASERPSAAAPPARAAPRAGSRRGRPAQPPAARVALLERPRGARDGLGAAARPHEGQRAHPGVEVGQQRGDLGGGAGAGPAASVAAPTAPGVAGPPRGVVLHGHDVETGEAGRRGGRVGRGGRGQHETGERRGAPPPVAGYAAPRPPGRRRPLGSGASRRPRPRGPARTRPTGRAGEHREVQHVGVGRAGSPPADGPTALLGRTVAVDHDRRHLGAGAVRAAAGRPRAPSSASVQRPRGG